jgi:bifunctional non-homologous end joining protein LigD
VRADGQEVRVTSLDRVIFPAATFTKAHLLDYYLQVAPRLLPHVVDRPATLRRIPEGPEGPDFFQTRAPPTHRGCGRWSCRSARGRASTPS